MIEFRGVSKTYKRGGKVFQALRNIHLTIFNNECVAIVGPSGSGKSTLMHIMGLLDTPTHGDYYLDGQSTQQLNRKAQAFYRNKKIGFIFQQFFLLPRLTVLENVALPLCYRRIPKKDRDAIAKEMLDRVGLVSHAAHRPSELSGGQQQRVAIARALVGKPSIILADEPTGALDTHTSQSIVCLLKTFVCEATLVIITHDVAIAAQCPRQLQVLDGCCSDRY